MITFCILLVCALIFAAILAIFGAGWFVIFGDLFVCGLIMFGLVKLFMRKK